METEKLSPYAPSSGALSAGRGQSFLPMSASKKAIGVGSATFTTFATVLTVCLVLLLAGDSNSSAHAEELFAPVTLHILDTSTGSPAGGVLCQLERNTTEGWVLVGSSTTGTDGRINNIVPDEVSELDTGVYRMVFHTKEYFDALAVDTFYPQIDVLFMLSDPSQSYHIPLILSPWGYTTYRGS